MFGWQGGGVTQQHKQDSSTALEAHAMPKRDLDKEANDHQDSRTWA